MIILWSTQSSHDHHVIIILIPELCLVDESSGGRIELWSQELCKECLLNSAKECHSIQCLLRILLSRQERELVPFNCATYQPCLISYAKKEEQFYSALPLSNQPLEHLLIRAIWQAMPGCQWVSRNPLKNLLTSSQTLGRCGSTRNASRRWWADDVIMMMSASPRAREGLG